MYTYEVYLVRLLGRNFNTTDRRNSFGTLADSTSTIKETIIHINNNYTQFDKNDDL